jgi:hypothetical protein
MSTLGGAAKSGQQIPDAALRRLASAAKRVFVSRSKSVFTISRAKARQGKNERKSGMYERYMSILSWFLTPYRRRAADRKQVLKSAPPR